MGEGRITVLGDDHALAGGEPIGLDDVRGAQLVESGLEFGAGGGAQRATGRNAGGIHDPLREGLRALELRCRLPRSEHRDAAGAEGVGDPCDERSLRADHDEVDGVVVGEFGDRGGIVLVEVDERRILADSGVAGRCEDLVRLRLGAQGEDDGVLSRARAEDQDLHPASLPSGFAPRRGPQLSLAGMAHLQPARVSARAAPAATFAD